MTLYHYTCADHGADRIKRDGFVRPLYELVGPLTPMPTSGYFAWLTDLDVPNARGLGLTRYLAKCDRTEHRFTVADETNCVRWLDVRRELPKLHHLELAPGAMPAHWWIASGPVPVEVLT